MNTEMMTKKMIHYSTVALIFFSGAWFVLLSGCLPSTRSVPQEFFSPLCWSPLCGDQHRLFCALCADLKKNKKGKSAIKPWLKQKSRATTPTIPRRVHTSILIS